MSKRSSSVSKKRPKSYDFDDDSEDDQPSRKALLPTIADKDLPGYVEAAAITSSDKSKYRGEVSFWNLKTAIQQKYHRYADIGSFTDDLMPTSYCYYEDHETKPSNGEYMPIRYAATFTFMETMVPSCKMLWKELKRCEKTQLYLLLVEMKSLLNTIEFDSKDERWMPTIENVSSAGSDMDDTIMYYGHKDEDNRILKVLIDGRSRKEMMEDLETYNKLLREEPILNEEFRAALLSDMANGDARAAVGKLLERIIKIMRGIYPKQTLGIVHEDCFSDSESGSVKDLRSKSESSQGTSSVSKQSDLKSDTCNDKRKKGGNTAEKKECEKKSKAKHNRHYVDLQVICDDSLQIGKYLLLVEILSHGKSKAQATAKFVKELVAALQGQSEVFGLLISATSATLYNVTKKYDPEERILILKHCYSFLSEDRDKRMLHVSISGLQNMCMDILTCLLYGVKVITS